MTDDVPSHGDLASALRDRVLGSGVLARELRHGILARGGGDRTPLDAPYDALVAQIADASYRVVDRQVDDVREATESQKAAFEVVLAGCIGAGLARWDAASAAIEGAGDASS